MNTEHLRYLLTAAECRSISKASEQLFLKQQHLSNIIKNLEQQLSVTIFERHSRASPLRKMGHIYWKRSPRLFI